MVSRQWSCRFKKEEAVNQLPPIYRKLQKEKIKHPLHQAIS